MHAKLIGIQNICFKNNLNEEIRGMNIFCAFKDENVEGFRTEKFFLNNGITLPKEAKLNDTITLFFNMRGKVEMVQKAD